MDNHSFSEVQYFRRTGAWLLVLSVNAFFIYVIIQQIVFGKPFGDKPVGNLQLVLLELAPLALLVFISSIRLNTTINERGISYRYFPFQSKKTFIGWDELRDAYLREYNSFYEYGGWGIRSGTAKTGRAINTSQSGRVGLQLVFEDGRLLLIGTRHPDEIAPLLKNAMDTGKINRTV